MPSSVTDWVLSLLTLGLIAVSSVYCGVSALLGRARRRRGEPVPGVYPGSAAHREALERAGVASMAEWRRRSTEEQEAHDNAVLDANESAEDAVRRVVEMDVQRGLEQAARPKALFHP